MSTNPNLDVRIHLRSVNFDLVGSEGILRIPSRLAHREGKEAVPAKGARGGPAGTFLDPFRIPAVSQYETEFHIDFEVILSTMLRASSDFPPLRGIRKDSVLPAARLRKRSARTSLRQSAGSGSSKSLQKAIRLLLHLGEYGPEMGLSQLAAELRLNKATVYRLLNAMQEFEIIEKNPENERYRLGLQLYQLGCRALESRTLRSEAHRFLLELAKRCKESVSLAVPATEGIVCLDRVDSPGFIITARTPIGGRFPAHCTAAGKAILAYLPEPEVRAIIDRNGMHMYTDRTINRYAALLENLALIRHEGCAHDSGELEKGLSGVAAPIFIRGGQMIASLGIAGPTQRFQESDLKEKIDLVMDFAGRISKALGTRASQLPVPALSNFYDPFS
jgi:IclR family KDG regulon transcriptional repressor